MNFNRVILGGHLTRKPELRYTHNDVPVASGGLAVNRRWKGKDGQDRNEVCFVDFDIWGARGEALAKHFDKGDPILIEGRLVLDEWTAKDGTRRQRLKVRVESWSLSPPCARRTGRGRPSGRLRPRSPGASNPSPVHSMRRALRKCGPRRLGPARSGTVLRLHQTTTSRFKIK
ncbi:MAG TPA: single-stranded DNA-binding protein [Phycisphaerales bacterium]|nr:single-stranded DNA-binding protein [Phycisphaerales bacterium]